MHYSSDTKIQFKIGNSKITSKIIDGKFHDYQKVVPKNNSKILSVNAKDLINSVERFTTVSIDRKELVKITGGFDLEYLAYDPVEDERFAIENAIKYCSINNLLSIIYNNFL